jgi:hypothetical protein
MENPRDMAKFEWQTNTVPIYLHEQKIEKNVTWKLHIIIIIKLCALPVEFLFQHWPRTTITRKMEPTNTIINAVVVMAMLPTMTSPLVTQKSVQLHKSLQFLPSSWNKHTI